jgi:hypothetical protein
MRGLDDRPRLSAVVTVLMAVAVLVLAWGNDASNSARAAVGDATGPMVADSLGGGAILSAANLGPGQATTGEVSVTNVGDSAGDMVLGKSGLADVTVRGGVLSRMLDLEVVDVSPDREPAVVFAGKLSDLGTTILGVYQQGESHRFRFTVSYPAGQSAFVDDPYQGATTRVSFVWSVAGISPPVDPGPGTPGGGQTAPVGGGGGIIEDHVQQSLAPGALKLRVYVRRVQAAHPKRVYVNVFCSHGCKLSATGTVSLPSRKKKWKMRVLKGSVGKAGTVKFKLPLPTRALPLLNRALLHHRKASVKLRITAKSGAQTLHWTRTIHLAR